MAEPWRPLDYRLGSVEGRQVVAYDPAGPGRIVEVFGQLDGARHVAIVVPGNAQSLADYPDASGPAALRRAAHHLHTTLTEIAPAEPATVLAWLGYRCPRGLLAAATPAAAHAGANDLRRLTHWLPAVARITLIGHSYGSLVCALAAAGGRVDDLVALASPGLGVWQARQLPTSARIWAARGPDDWVRLLPSIRIAGLGHRRQPAHPRFGAAILPSGDTHGHSGYYQPGSATLRAVATVVTGHNPAVSTVVPAREGAVSSPAL